MKNFKIKGVDGKDYWISRSVAVHAQIILHDIEGDSGDVFVLLIRRGPGCPDHVGKLADITGYVDWDERLEEALIREVYEEVGLDLRKVRHQKEVSWIYDVPEGLQNITIGYRVHASLNEVRRLIETGVINTNTESRGGEKNEVSEIKLLWINDPDIEDVRSEDFAFNHADVTNRLIEEYRDN